MPQSTLITSNQSSLNNNLQSLHKLLFFSSLLSVQPQQLIWTIYTKTSFQLSLMTKLLQNTSPQMADSLWIQVASSFLITESMYYLQVISAHIFSSIIMIISLLDIMVKTKHQNQFVTNIPGLASILIYNNFASSVLLVCNLSHNITSSMDLSNNSQSLNNHGISFLQTSLRNSCYFLSLILFWLQSTSLPSRQFLSLPMTPSHSQTQYVYWFFMYSPNMAFLSMSPLIVAQSLCQTSSILQTLL